MAGMKETHILFNRAGDEPAKSGIWERVADQWCMLMHNAVMWPIHGQYRCRRCGRLHAVPWSHSHTISPKSTLFGPVYDLVPAAIPPGK